MSSYIDEAERALSRCRKVKTGDIIMPDDVNCLADGAVSSVNAIKHLLNEIYFKTYYTDLLEYYHRRYGDYNVDRTGALILLEQPDTTFRDPRGGILFDGADADEVVISLPKLDLDSCLVRGDFFAIMALVGQGGVKYLDLPVRPSTTVKFKDPDLVALFFTRPDFSTAVRIGEIVKVPEAINVSFRKGSLVTKSYTVDVIGQLCGDKAYPYCYDLKMDVANADVLPLAPERWYAAEFSDYSTSPSNICAIALDSTNDALAEVLAYECARGSSVYIRVPPNTKKIKLAVIDAAWMLSGFTYYYLEVMYFGRPDLKPNVEGDKLYCLFNYPLQ